MVRISILMLLLVFPLICCAEDVDSGESMYVPKNLEECFAELEVVLPPRVLKRFKNIEENLVLSYRYGLARWIRVNWGLCSNSRLAKYFHEKGIFYPADMSSLILISFHRHLHERAIRLDEQIKQHKYFWRAMKWRRM